MSHWHYCWALVTNDIDLSLAILWQFNHLSHWFVLANQDKLSKMQLNAENMCIDVCGLKLPKINDICNRTITNILAQNISSNKTIFLPRMPWASIWQGLYCDCGYQALNAKWNNSQALFTHNILTHNIAKLW